MTWISFLTSVLVIYGLYYGVNVAYDLLFATGNKNSNKEEIIPLTFEDEIIEKSVDEENEVVSFNEIEEDISIDRKEVITKENVIKKEDMEQETISPTGTVKTLVSGGIDLKSLLKQASDGALETTRKINFAEA